MNTISRSRPAALACGIAAVTLALAACGGGSTAASPPRSPGGAFGANSARISNLYLPISKFNRCVLGGQETATSASGWCECCSKDGALPGRRPDGQDGSRP